MTKISEGQTLFKIIVVFGVLALLISLLAADGRVPAEVSAWNSLQATVSAGIVFPTFVDPFIDAIGQTKSIVDQAAQVIDSSNYSFVGCTNTSSGRVKCMNTLDGDSSYLRMDEGNLQFNWSGSPQDLDHTKIRRARYTVQCRTEINETASAMFLVNWGNSVQAFLQICPISNDYATITYDIITPTGVTDPISILGFDSILSLYEILVPTYFPFVRISYIQMELFGEAQSGGCQAPDGAWLPFLDETACAIGRFGDQVYKGILFFVNGVIFIVQSIVAVISFFTSVLFGLLIGISSIAIFFLAIPGAPGPVQAFVSAIFIGFIVYVIYISAKLLRGSEGGA